MTTVYAAIGNSDDKLSQRQWAQFLACFSATITAEAYVHGEWFSSPTSAYQNACMCFEIDNPMQLKRSLKLLAAQFGQDSIAWAEVTSTEFIGHAS